MKIFTFLKTAPSYFLSNSLYRRVRVFIKLILKITKSKIILFFFRPGQVHDLVFNHKNTKGFLINFNENLFNQFLLQANFIDQLPLFSKSGKNCYHQIQNNQKDIKYAFAKILDFNDGSYKYSSELIKLCILEILLLIF